MNKVALGAALALLLLFTYLVSPRPAYAFTYALCLLFVVAWVWPRLAIRGISLVRRLDPGTPTVGEPYEEVIEVRRSGWVPAPWVEIRDLGQIPGYQPGRVISVGSDVVSWKTRGVYRRRGWMSFGPTSVSVREPFGLFDQQLKVGNRTTVLVYPRVRLIHEAIADQLTCVFVDHGLLRLGEARKVISLFRDSYNIPLVHVEAEELFLKNLAGVEDPELKRKTIGRLFIDVFEAEAKKLGGAEFLAQGTLYPDVIESVSFSGGPSVTIKSHHNVGGLPERMNMKLVEPLRDLFKDEVRALGRELGLPQAFVGRHPFPGPGLAIRCPGEITREKLDILRRADDVYVEEIGRAGLYDDIW